MRFVDVAGGLTKRIATWEGRVDPERWHDLVFRFRGHSFEVRLDGARVVKSLHGGPVVAGRAGIVASGDGAVLADSLSIR